jgi:hypothetical protein
MGIASASVLACACVVFAAAPDTAPRKGRVLVLDNQRLLEGDIEREVDGFRIRRGDSESWIPMKQAVQLCASRAEAYEYLRGRTNLHDLDERLKLARWCLLYDLKLEGLSEAKAALELKPSCVEAQRLLRCFQRTEDVPSPTKPARPVEPARSTQAIDVSMEDSTQFATRVQPILMNACVSCHGTEKSGAFHLTNTFDEGALNRKATQENLAAALAQINRANWQASPLLTKAMTIHGPMAQPALKGRQLSAFHVLEAWVQRVAVNSPEPAAPQAVASAQPPPAEPLPVKPEREPKSQSRSEAPLEKREPKPQPRSEAPEEKHEPTPKATGIFAAVEKQKKDPPAEVKADGPREVPHAPVSTPAATPPPAEPADPFDPLLFNRAEHPEAAPAEKQP